MLQYGYLFRTLLPKKAHPGTSIDRYKGIGFGQEKSNEVSAMKSLVPLALVGLVLAIGLALPFSEDKDEVDRAELKNNANDFSADDSEK